MKAEGRAAMSADLARLVGLAPPTVRDALPVEDWVDLERRYQQPIRAYHNLHHIIEVAEQVRDVSWERPAAVFCAVLFHDAVYRPLRKDNERQSAELARGVVAARLAPAVDPGAVADLILLTARHGRLDPTEVDADAAQFLDADMAILGAPPERYLAYARGVAAEYAVVPRFLYRRMRGRFLRALLERPRIFLSDAFHHRLDAQARRNLTAELAGNPT